MPVPSTIADLSTTPGSNSPAGSESPALMDDYLRTAFAFIKQLEGQSVNLTGNQTIAGVKTFSIPIAGSITGNAATATAAIGLTATLPVDKGGTGETDDSRLAQPGDVKYTARNTAPPGWLKANGAAVSRTTYAALFAAIGTTFGVGDGSTTFNLPNLRGEFIRGWDDARGVDAGRVFGSAQSDELKSHTHTATAATSVDGRFTATGSGGAAGSSITTAASGGAETRPRNVALLAVIKY